MDFKVGDIITGLPSSNERYNYTNERMTKGEVVSKDRYRIRVRILEHLHQHLIGTEHEVQPEFFRLAEEEFIPEEEPAEEPIEEEFIEEATVRIISEENGTYIIINEKYTFFTTAIENQIGVATLTTLKEINEIDILKAIALSK